MISACKHRAIHSRQHRLNNSLMIYCNPRTTELIQLVEGLLEFPVIFLSLDQALWMFSTKAGMLHQVLNYKLGLKKKKNFVIINK